MTRDLCILQIRTFNMRKTVIKGILARQFLSCLMARDFLCQGNQMALIPYPGTDQVDCTP